MRPTTSSPSSAKKGGKAQSAMYSVTPKLHRSTAWWSDAGEGGQKAREGWGEGDKGAKKAYGLEKRKAQSGGGGDGAREWCDAELWGEK